MNSSAVLTAASGNPPLAPAAAASALVRAAGIALMVAVPLVVTPWGTDAYSGPKVLVVYGLTAVIAVGWLGVVASRRARWIPTAPELAVLAFLLAALLSSLASVHPRLTLFGAPGRYEGLLTVVCYVVVFFAGAHFFGSAAGFRTLSVAAGAAAAVAIVYGLVQVRVPPLFAGEAVIREWYASFGLPRVFSTLGSPVVFGGYLSVMIPLLLALALSTEGRARSVWLFVAALGVVAAAATLTRAAWLAVGVGTAFFVGMIGPAARRRHRVALAVVAAAVVAAAAVLFTSIGAPEQITERVTSSVSVQVGSAAQRVYIWRRTAELIGRRPLLGWGLDTLREIFPYDRPALVRYFGLRPVIIDKAHNDLLQVAVSVGLPGALAYAAAWVLIIAAAVRARRHQAGPDRILAAGAVAGLCGYLIQAQFSFSTVALAPGVWLLAGAVAGWERAQAEGAA